MSRRNGRAARPVEKFKVEVVSVDDLRPHPKNYRAHPEDQVQHLVKSLQEHGFYRNIVTARDGTILAGHGIVTAAKKIGMKRVPIIRLSVGPDDVGAIKVMIGDNEIDHLAEQNDRLLTELLKSIKDGGDLMGTGYDEMMLANLLMVTRPESEIKDFDAAAAWVGLPEYESGADDKIRLIVTFPDEKKREQFVAQTKLRLDIQRGLVWSTRWPWSDREDKASIRFTSQTA